MTAIALKLKIANLTKDDIRYINERRIEDFDHLGFQEEVKILKNDLINKFRLQGVSMNRIHIEDNYFGVSIYFEEAVIQHNHFTGLTDKEKNDFFNYYSVLRDKELKLGSANNSTSKDEVKEIYSKNIKTTLIHKHIQRLSDMQLAKRVFDLESFTIIQTLIHHHSFVFKFRLSNGNEGVYCDYKYEGSSRLLDKIDKTLCLALEPGNQLFDYNIQKRGGSLPPSGTFEYLKAMLRLGADELFPELSDYKILVATKQKEHPYIDSNRFIINGYFRAFIYIKVVQSIQENAKNVVDEMKVEVKQRYKELKSYFRSEEYLMKLLQNPDKQQDLLDYLN